MAWQEFKQIVLNQGCEPLEEYEIIIPPGLAVDMMYAKRLDVGLYWRFIRGNKHQFQSEKQFNTFIRNLRSFDTTFGTCWPCIEELWDHGDKWNQIERLDYIARIITNSTRPKSILLKSSDAFPLGESIVLKRTYSDGASHVIERPTSDKVRSIRTPKHAKWFQQELVESLLAIGELRTGVGSKNHIIFRLNTVRDKSGQWLYAVLKHIGPLLTLSYKWVPYSIH